MGKKGQIPWNKGGKGLWKMPPEIRQKISIANKGKKKPPRTVEHTRKMKLALKGKNTWRKGKAPWNKGKTGIYSEEVLKKMSEAKKGKHNPARSGENSNWWKGGIQPINLAIRGSLEYKLWREAVFKRDNYTCVWCGDNKGGNLNADHVKPFAHYPELRFAIDNGRTLCVPCHRTTDTYGGNGRAKLD